MTGLETNVFPITNLKSLSSLYRLYQIRGLDPEHDEFYFNCALLKRKLSYMLRNPVTIIKRDDMLCLVVRAEEGDAQPAASLALVRGTVHLTALPELFTLDYTLRSPQNDEICLRFLSFMLQEPLLRRSALWQTASGQPFFRRNARALPPNLDLFQGFKIRPVATPDGGLGLSVDVVHRFVGNQPIAYQMTRDEFARWKGRTFIYHYGLQWYQIQARSLSDLNLGEYEVLKDGRMLSLLHLIHDQCDKPMPPEIAKLETQDSVLLYRNNRGDERAAPVSLCYPLFDVHDNQVARLHRETILDPNRRRTAARDFVGEHLRGLSFGKSELSVAAESICVERRIFPVPDLEFGGGQVLSVQGTCGARSIGLDQLGRARKSLLKEPSAGFYEQDPLGQQYFLMPQSVFDSWGPQFLRDLQAQVNGIFPQENGYDPTIVTYDDRCPKTYARQGRALMDAARQAALREGCALVMIHPTTDQQKRQEDQLEAMSIRELRDLGLTAAVMHTAVGQECYAHQRGSGGQSRYQMRPDKRSKLSGYLFGVALNSVLLTNQRWPFVLKTPLHADITIGVDVKHHTAGLVVVGSNGADVRTLFKTSRQKEKLEARQFASYLEEIIGAEAQARAEPIRVIVIHRDGRLFDSERQGAARALEKLKGAGLVAADATLTVVEIQKSSPVPLRLFDRIDKADGRPWVENPQVGCYYMPSQEEGFLCTTGRAFNHPGTVNPLHVRRAMGDLPLEKCLQDIYALTVLAWTRPEDCTRNPITIKLNDRYLGEAATFYDAELLEFGEDDDSDADES